MSCNETLALLGHPSSDQLYRHQLLYSSVETVNHDTYDMQVSSSSSPISDISPISPLSLPSTPDDSVYCLQHAKSDDYTPQLVIATTLE